jgi:sugar lactone lactonase YvrE
VGNAYVTDSFSDAIYRVDPEGTVSILVRSSAFDARRTDSRPNVGMNGIVWHPSGYLLAVRYDTGKLFRIPVDRPEQFTEVRLDQPVIGADGIALRPDWTLLVATNTIRADGIDGVFWLRSTDGWRSARTLSRMTWPDPAPTTLAITPYGDYVLSSHADLLFGSGGRRTADGLILRRVD